MIMMTMTTNTTITTMGADPITITTMMSMNMYTEAAALAANMTTMKKKS